VYKNKLLLLIIITAIIKCIAANTIELGNDEVYYYTYALHWQFNYFDHPPGITLLIKLFTADLFFSDQFFLRLGAIVCCSVSTYLIFQIGKRFFSENIGWIAAVLYNTSLYSGIICGFFIMPDSLQTVFWLAAIYYLLAVHSSNKTKDWLLFGFFTGLCMMCKIHGVFLWFGFGVYILFVNRKIFFRPQLYMSVLITAIVVSPILFWNMQNDFITFRYHGDRFGATGIHIDDFLQAFFGQLFYNNPVNVILTFVALYFLTKRKMISDSIRLLLCMGLFMIITVTGMSLFNPVLPHWSGPGFVTLLFIPAVFLSEMKKVHLKRIWLRAGTGLIAVAFFGGIAAIQFLPMTIGSKQKYELGANDFTLDMYGWRTFGTEFRTWCTEQISQGTIPPDVKFISNNWFPASHLEYYVTRQLQKPVIGIGHLRDLHHFKWLNDRRDSLHANENAIVIQPSNWSLDVKQFYGDKFQSIQLLKTFEQKRSGTVVRFMDVYYLQNFAGVSNVLY
jgi:hypothetical protein